MKISDVPQDRGMIDQENVAEVCYAVDDEGRYVLSPSAGWEPKNIANDQAWEVIRGQLVAVIAKINKGKLSPLAYHMVKNQMTPALLAKYAECSWWRVRRHLKPSGFKTMSIEMCRRYSELFEIPMEALGEIPKEGAPVSPDLQAPAG